MLQAIPFSACLFPMIWKRFLLQFITTGKMTKYLLQNLLFAMLLGLSNECRGRVIYLVQNLLRNDVKGHMLPGAMLFG